MSTVAIPIRQVDRDGQALLGAVAATNDMGIPSNDGLVLVAITNPTGGSLTATFIPSATYAGIPLADVDVVVPANSTRWAGPWPPALFNQDDGSVLVSAATGLTLTGLRI